MATRGYYEFYTISELKELVPQSREAFESYTPKLSIEESLSKNDDRFLSNTWTEAYRMAAYYFDNPRIDDRISYFNRFRFHFAGLLQKTNIPNEIPDMKNRNQFVGWVCKKHNEFLEKAEGSFRVDCSDVDKLVQTYGPNYQKVKSVLGGSEYFY
jgi:hypothetical protein